jgi:HAD superfamily hydrolase (TIGR01509 family)
VRALILDCDGVIAETERELHLPAFNQAFREFGLRLRWTSEEYGERLRIAGGKERVLASLTHPDTRALGLSDSPEARRELVERVHRRKTEIVAEMLGRQPPPPRAGVRRLTTAAHAAGWRLAVASTSTEDSVRRVVESVIGRELAGHVLFLAGDVVTAKKPDPEIYELALARLGATPAEAIVVEDSAIGLHAARAAGLTCLVTVSEYTRHEEFDGAALVLSSLGDPGQPMTVISSRSAFSPGSELSLADLEALLRDSEASRS